MASICACSVSGAEVLLSVGAALGDGEGCDGGGGVCDTCGERLAGGGGAIGPAGGTERPIGCAPGLPGGGEATAVGGCPPWPLKMRRSSSRRPSGPSNTARRGSSEVRRQAGCDS